MPVVFSNQLKALLVTEDIMEQSASSFTHGDCLTVQHFSYQCLRKRDSSGVPYGPTAPSYLDFTVKISSGESAKVFFRRMQQYEAFSYSFLFNASFNDKRRISAFEDAMVARGYLIEVEEAYENQAGKTEGEQEQMLIRARLLLCKITYLGSNRNMELMISHD